MTRIGRVRPRHWLIVAGAAAFAVLASVAVATAVSGTATASCGAVQANGTSKCTGQWTVNVPVPTQTVTTTTTVTVTAAPPPTTPPPAAQPVGDPLGRTWTLAFGDEFSGTAIDTTNWVALNNWSNNNVTSQPKNCTESGGNLVLALPGDGTGCDLYGSAASALAQDGKTTTDHALVADGTQNSADGKSWTGTMVGDGDYVEARIWLPGPGTTPSDSIYNWPAFWAYDGSGNWNAGETDISEGENKLEFNYAQTGGGNTQSISPVGNWSNSWHVYGVYRNKTTNTEQVYWDGTLIDTFTTNDNGGPEELMFTSGASDTCCGAPPATGAAGNVLVDWVHVWQG